MYQNQILSSCNSGNDIGFIRKDCSLYQSFTSEFIDLCLLSIDLSYGFTVLAIVNLEEYLLLTPPAVKKSSIYLFTLLSVFKESLIPNFFLSRWEHDLFSLLLEWSEHDPPPATLMLISTSHTMVDPYLMFKRKDT